MRFGRRVAGRGKVTEIFYDADADLGRLDGRTVAVIGYGIQGRVQALNMRASGVENVLVGSIRDESWEQAEADGFSPMPVREAAEEAGISFVLVPDEVAPGVYEEHVEPALGPGKTLNIAFAHIRPPEEVDVNMVAPRMFGEGVRALFVEGKERALLRERPPGRLRRSLGRLPGPRPGRRLYAGRGSTSLYGARDLDGLARQAGDLAVAHGRFLERLRVAGRGRDTAGGRAARDVRVQRKNRPRSWAASRRRVSSSNSGCTTTQASTVRSPASKSSTGSPYRPSCVRPSKNASSPDGSIKSGSAHRAPASRSWRSS